jgi:hypothetical protein
MTLSGLADLSLLFLLVSALALSASAEWWGWPHWLVHRNRFVPRCDRCWRRLIP